METLENKSVKEDSRIFLTDYASYNNGTQFQFGHWVDLDQFSDADELRDYIQEHFKECDEESPLDSPREEIMITDYEGFPDEFYSESGMDFDLLFEFFDKVEDCYLDYEVIEAYAALGSYSLSDLDEFFENLEEAYQGEYSSDEDFAESFAEELGYINDSVQWPYTCIDWQHAARELMYDYNESNGHYFRTL